MSSGLDEDAQVKLAIQLSLNQNQPVPSFNSGERENIGRDGVGSNCESTNGRTRGIRGRFFKSKSRNSSPSDNNESPITYDNISDERKKSKIYKARRSLRVKNVQHLPPGGDGDTWIEGFAVSTPEVSEASADGTVNITPFVRSYFYSQNTGRREWDEPPSGASSVRYASREARALAEVQADALANEILTGTREHMIPRQQATINEDDEFQRAVKLSVKELSRKASIEESKASDDSLERAMELSRLECQKNLQKRSACDTEDEAIALAMAISLSDQPSGVKSFVDDPTCHLRNHDTSHEDDVKIPAVTTITTRTALPQSNDERLHNEKNLSISENFKKEI